MTLSRQLPLVFALLTGLGLAGCASAPKQSTAQTVEQNDKSVELLSKVAGSLDRLGAENKQLRAENADLKKTVQTLQSYLQINDCLATNKEAIVQNLIETWTPQRDALWKAQGGTGLVVDFAVQDVVFYNRYIVVQTLFLAKNQDQSGVLAKGFVALDPNKNLEIAGCVMDEHSTLSKQERYVWPLSESRTGA